MYETQEIYVSNWSNWLTLTGCDDPNTSSSQTSGSETSEITEAERFSALVIHRLRLPVESIRMHYTRKDRCSVGIHECFNTNRIWSKY